MSVASGPDPESVIALLLDAARSGQHLLEEPALQVVFKGFGKGSLDVVVQAWTDQEYDASQTVTSELGLALHRSLRGRDRSTVTPEPSRRGSPSGPRSRPCART